MNLSMAERSKQIGKLWSSLALEQKKVNVVKCNNRLLRYKDLFVENYICYKYV